MDIITQVIEWLIRFLGTEASLSRTIINALLTPLSAYILWLISKRMLAILDHQAIYFKFIQIRKDLIAILQKTVALVLVWLVGLIWIRLFHVQAIETLFHAIFIVISATPIKSFLLIILEYLERKLADRTETMLDNIVIDLLNKFSGAIVYATAVIIALDILGVNVMPFIAGAGVMGVAVGFAAKDTLSNLIAGILLIIDRPFENGYGEDLF